MVQHELPTNSPATPEANLGGIPDIPVFAVDAAGGVTRRVGVGRKRYQAAQQEIMASLEPATLSEENRERLNTSAHIAKEYLKREAEQAGYPITDYVDALNPMYVTPDFVRSFTGKPRVGFSYQGATVVAAQERGLYPPFVAMSIMAHELSHAATTRYFEDGVSSEGTTHSLYVGLNDKRISIQRGNNSFLEEAMATWDEVRIAQEVKKQGLFRKDFLKKKLNLFWIRHSKMAKGFLAEYEFIDRVKPSKTEAWEALLLTPLAVPLDLGLASNNMRYLVYIKHLALALGRHVTANTKLSAEEYTEVGRKYLQKSRFSSNPTALQQLERTIYDMFGEDGKEYANTILQHGDWKTLDISNSDDKTVRGSVKKAWQQGTEQAEDGNAMVNALLYLDAKQALDRGWTAERIENHRRIGSVYSK